MVVALPCAVRIFCRRGEPIATSYSWDGLQLRNPGVSREGAGRHAPFQLELVMLDLSARSFAWIMSHAAHHYQTLAADRKRKLFSDLRGTVVEIGAGTGTNFTFVPAGVRWIAIEPNRHTPVGHQNLVVA